MKKNVLYISIYLTVCIILGLAYSFHRYYAPPRIKQPYLINVTPDDTLRIAYIGDSWAAIHKEHECIIAKIIEDSIHLPVIISSFGIRGKTSKEIYENLFDNGEFRLFLSKRRYQYCYISAGINDTYKKMSTSYYQQSMDGIIQLLLSNHIYPILQEIPDYDIHMSFERQEPSRILLRRLSMIINNMPLDCKQIFRDALDEMIRRKEYQNKVCIIRYKSWDNDYYNDLSQQYLNDGLHLNEQGYSELDSVIAKEIISLM